MMARARPPAGVSCTVNIGEKEWRSQPLPVFDAAIYPIEDVAQLDQRRLSMGLSTNAYYLALKKRWAEKAAAQPERPKS